MFKPNVGQSSVTGHHHPRWSLWLIIGVAVLAGLFFSYRFWVAHEQKIDYRIFDTRETISWALHPEGIFRVGAKGHMDNVLISREAWEQFTLGFELSNARDCGVVFGYQNADNFYFVNLNREAGIAMVGRNNSGQLEGLQRVPLTWRPVYRMRLDGRPGETVLTVDGVELARVPVSNGGKFGLLNNDAQNPKTYFSAVRLDGVRAGGGKIRASFPPENGAGVVVRMKGAGPFYLAMLAAVLFLVLLARRARLSAARILQRERTPLNVSPWAALSVHLLLAVAVFWPFVSQGAVLISSYDNLGEIYPLFFFSKHNFWQILKGQSLCLWNPFTHDGVPFFSNHWNMIYYPFNWPVFCLPDAWVMKGLTLKSFIEVFLTGVFAFGFFRRVLGSREWALFASISYQLCSLLIFTATVFPASSLYFCQMLYLYVLWSMPRRRARVNFVLLVFCGALILTSANVAFIFYSAAALAVITVYRFLTVEKDKGTTAAVVAAGLAVAGLIGAVRILPCLMGISDSNRLVESYYTLHDRLPMIIRLFLPEIAGRFGTDAFPVLTSPNLRLIFQQANLPSNPQNTFFVYFGIIPAVLLAASWFLRARGELVFWRTYAWCAIAVALLFQPVWGLLCVLFFPMNHFSYHTLIIPAGVGVLVGLVGQRVMEGEGGRLKALGRRVVGLLLLAEIYILVFVTYLFPDLTPLSRCVLGMILLGWAGYALLRRYRPSGIKPAVGAALTLFNAAIWTALFAAGHLVLARPLVHKESLVELVTLPLLSALAVVVTALYLYAGRTAQRGLSFRVLAFVILVPLALGGVLASGVFSQARDLGEPQHIYLVDLLLGQVKFFLIAQLALLGVVLVRVGKAGRSLVMALFCLVTAADLVAFNYRFDNITAPFFFSHAFYPSNFQYLDVPPQVKAGLDLVNYRISSLDKAMVNANKHIIYDIPTYTGIIGYMPRRFSNLIENFGYPKGTILIYPEDSSTDERFLDLSSVKYVFVDERRVQERPSALARMSLFSQVEAVAEDFRALERLKDPGFDPSSRVILSQTPTGFVSAPRAAQPVAIVSAGRDRVEALVKSEGPAVLLFNESWDRGWRAEVDGRRVPVMTANYNFMACLVPSGEHRVVFLYQPAEFFLLVKFAFAGLLIWGAGILFCFLPARFSKKEGTCIKE